MGKLKTSVGTIKNTLSVCIKNNITFAAWRLPNRQEKNLIIQKNDQINILNDQSEIVSRKGFLVAPFVQPGSNPMFIIKPDFYFKGEVNPESIEELKSLKFKNQETHDSSQHYEVSKNEYLDQIASVKEAIKNKSIQKAVLSRIKIVNGSYKKSLPNYFQKLCELFPNAFVYIFRAGPYFWMGATPEPLVYFNNHFLNTSSVAGTKENNQKFHTLNNWGEKEKLEQKIVSDHIENVLKTVSRGDILQVGPYIKKAGNLLHLRTDFTTQVQMVNGSFGYLLKNLHPTPAVCGYETDAALDLIKKIEKHNREYYSGFLGPVGLDEGISLFVNLRCMQINDSYLSLFVGGGITFDSIPEDEWYETEIKAGTMLSVIKEKN